jgi:hypothetical protein
VSYQAVVKWEANGRLPYTELSGETWYAELIERLTEGRVTKAELWAASFPGRPRDAANESEVSAHGC